VRRNGARCLWGGGCGIEGQGAGGQESGRGEGRAGWAGGAGEIGGGEGGGQRMVVLGVQLRFGGHHGYSQQWNDPQVLEPGDLRSAAMCLASLVHERGGGEGGLQVMVVGDHEQVRMCC
jgi:hypothetical protein